MIYCTCEHFVPFLEVCLCDFLSYFFFFVIVHLQYNSSSVFFIFVSCYNCEITVLSQVGVEGFQTLFFNVSLCIFSIH